MNMWINPKYRDLPILKRSAVVNLQRSLIGVGILVLNADQQVLLGKRIKKGESCCWCLPGGKVDLGESYEQAAARELFEETNLSIQAQQLKSYVMLNDLSREYLNVTIGLHVTLRDSVWIDSIKVTEPDIFEKWSWFSLSELPSVLFPETQVMLQFWKKEQVKSQFSVYPINI